MELNKNKRIAIMVTSILLGLLFAAYLLNKPNTSTTNYFPYINGSVFFLGGLYLFLLSFRIHKPKYKTVEQALKVDDLLKTWGKLWKVGSIVMILFGAYNLIWHDPDFYRLNSSIEKSRWINKDKEELLKICINKVGKIDKEHPQAVTSYCSCITDKFMKMNKQEYLDDLSMPKKEQDNKFNPMIQGCAIDYHHRVDSAEKEGK
jgi:hypothetical protein